MILFLRNGQIIFGSLIIYGCVIPVLNKVVLHFRTNGLKYQQTLKICKSWHFQTQLLYYICANLAYTDWLYSRWWRRQRMSSLILQLFGQCLLMRHWNWRCRTHFCSLSRSGAGEYCETLLHMSLDLSIKPAEWISVLLAGSTWRDQYLQF